MDTEFIELYKTIARFSANKIKRDHYSDLPYISYINRDKFIEWLKDEKEIYDIKKYINKK